MAKAVVTNAQNWQEIAKSAGGNPSLIMYDPATSELEVADVTQADLDTAVSGYGTAVPTDDYRDGAQAAVDTHCRKRILGGFEWPVASGKILSLSEVAQLKWAMLLLELKLPPGKQTISFPLTVPTKDNLDTHVVQDEDEVEDIYAAIASAVEQALSEATAAKQTVGSALTVTDLETARDDYLAT